MEGAIDALFLTSKEGRVLSWNPGAHDMLGYTEPEALGQPVGALIAPPEERAPFQAALEEALATGSAVSEIAARKKGGEELHVLAVLRRYEPEPEVRQIVCALRDISEQKRLSQQLFDQIWSLSNVQDVLTSVLDSSSDYAIVGVDNDEQIEIWNEGARNNFGHARADIAGAAVQDLLFDPAEVQSGRLAQALEAARAKGRFEDEFACVARDGRRFPARVAFSPRHAANGVPAGFVLILKDITEERAAGEALRRKTAFVALLQGVAVAANEARSVEEAMQKAIDAVCGAMDWPIGHVYVRSGEWSGGLSSAKIWHLEDAERFDTFQRVTEATRLPPGECLPGRVLTDGKPLWVPDFPAEAGVARSKTAREAGIRTAFGAPVLVGKEIVAVLEFFTQRRVKADEGVLEVMGHVGTQLGRVVERSRAQEDQRVALERVIEVEHLKEMDRFREQFIRTVSHELNTPITPLKLQLNLLKEQNLGPLTERQVKAVDILDRNVERLQLLVQDMLDVARIQGGQLKVFKKPTDLALVIKEAADLFLEPVQQSGIELRIPQDLEETIVEADPRRLVQILVNLLSNALKFTPSGGRVGVELRRKNGEVQVRVADSGSGLTPEQVALLFKPFSQVHDVAQTAHRGTGLGLYICKNLVEQHGGRIGCESAGPGKGSTFWFTLPLHARIPLKDAEPNPPESEGAVRLRQPASDAERSGPVESRPRSSSARSPALRR